MKTWHGHEHKNQVLRKSLLPYRTRQCTRHHHQPGPWRHPPWWIRGWWDPSAQRPSDQLHCCPSLRCRPGITELQSYTSEHFKRMDKKTPKNNTFHKIPTPIGEQRSTNFSSWDLAVPGSPSISKLMSPLRVRPSGSLKGPYFCKRYISF